MIILSGSDSGRTIGRYMPASSTKFKKASTVTPKNMNGKIFRYGAKGVGNRFINLLRRI